MAGNGLIADLFNEGVNHRPQARGVDVLADYEIAAGLKRHAIILLQFAHFRCSDEPTGPVVGYVRERHDLVRTVDRCTSEVDPAAENDVRVQERTSAAIPSSVTIGDSIKPFRGLMLMVGASACTVPARLIRMTPSRSNHLQFTERSKAVMPASVELAQ